MGDGGSGNDPNDRAQTTSSLLGKILRIDVSVPSSDPAGMAIPLTNPFRTNPAFRPEIWDIGLRNPWRFSFDSVGPGATNALIIGDVGQGGWEEVDYEAAGTGARNYGWRIREGANANIAGTPAFQPMIDPVYQYSHTSGRSLLVGQSITGGYVYRGSGMASYRGRYFFADYVTGHLFSAVVTPNASLEGAAFSEVIDHTPALDPVVRPGNISSFGLNAAGELFVLDYPTGVVLRLAQAKPTAPTNLRIIR